MIPFSIDRVREKMKEDFNKINTLDDLKDFLLQLLPKMMETDIDTSTYVVETLQSLRRIMRDVREKSEKALEEERGE